MNQYNLSAYVDACEMIRESENEMIRNRRRGTGALAQIELDRRLTDQAIANAEKIKNGVESWMYAAPVRIQRIICYKLFQHLSWEQVAAKMNEGKSGDAYRKQLKAYMKDS